MPSEFQIQIGSKMVDLLNPTADQIDLDAIEMRLKSSRRFSGHPGALTIHQHQMLVKRMVTEQFSVIPTFDMPEEVKDFWFHVIRWAKHHDDHEGVIGDIVAPVKKLVSSRSNILEIVETRLDIVICEARGFEYPTYMERQMLHHYDKMAETVEWRYAMRLDEEPWNYLLTDSPVTPWPELAEWAQRQ